MADRKYTVDEIVRMRAAAQIIATNSPVPISAEAIEAHLRTYLDNGIEPSDLDDKASRMKSGAS